MGFGLNDFRADVGEESMAKAYKVEAGRLWFGVRPGLFPRLKTEPANDERRIDERGLSRFIQQFLSEFFTKEKPDVRTKNHRR